jgi:hypothetical protein
MSDSTLYNALLDDDRKIGYKVVVRKNSKSFEPATSAALQRITYRLNAETRKVRGDHGPYAVFATLEQARKFAAQLDHRVAILLVEYEPSQEVELWKKNPPSFSRSRGFSRGYRAESNGTTERPLENCPAGTILADSVYVLEVLEEER